MQDIIIAVLTTLGITGGSLVIIFMIILMNPEKIDKWLGIIYKFLSGFGVLFKKAHRNYVKYDTQGRINEFTREIAKVAPYFEDTQIEVEWTHTDLDKKAFLNKGEAIIRLRQDDDEDLNFVHGAYWAISTQLLPRVKRYVSSSQRKAIDLFVTGDAIRKEKYHVRGYFFDHYLDKLDEETHTRNIYNKFDDIHRYGVFYPVFLQELYFLSLTIFGKLPNENIIKEVTRMSDFLLKRANRTVGANIDANFIGEFCKFGIVIVGTGEKMSLEGKKPYLKYIEKQLMPKKLERIYLIGKYEYYDFINELCEDLYMNYDIYKTHDFESTLNFEGGGTKTENSYLVVLTWLDNKRPQAS